DIRVTNEFAGATWPQHLDQLVAEKMSAVLVLVPAQPYRTDQSGIDAKIFPITIDERGKVILVRVAVGGHAHHPGVTVQHIESQIIRDRSIHPRQGIGVVELGNAVNFSLLSITEEHAGILTLHVNGHDGRALPEIAHVIGMTGMSKLVLDRHEVNPL